MHRRRCRRRRLRIHRKQNYKGRRGVERVILDQLKVGTRDAAEHAFYDWVKMVYRGYRSRRQVLMKGVV